MKKTFASLAVLTLLAATTGQARAAFINASPTGIPNPGEVVTFDELGLLPDNTLITNQFAPFGVTFSGFPLYYRVPGAPFTEAPPNITGGKLANFQNADVVPPGPPLPTYSVEFALPVKAAAFALATNIGNTTFMAFLDQTLVETSPTVMATQSPNDFYGFQNITFNRIVFTLAIANDASALVDTVQFTPVPEPSSFALGGLAAAGLAFQAWRRRKRAA